MIRRNTTLADFHSWTATFGREEATLTSVLQALLEAAAQPWSGAETLSPLFTAITDAGLKPSWDCLAAALRLLRPED